jgi:hypothetical protein
VQKKLAYCGLVCTDCPAYQATQNGDDKGLRDVAEQWSKHAKETIKPEDCICDGCIASELRHIPHWSECQIRICAAGKKVENCGWCDRFPCEQLETFLEGIPHA